MPVEHEVYALGRLQVMPQPPQWLVELSSRSQPFACPPSQLPQRGSQLTTWQVPDAHDVSEACGSVQRTPQPPQCALVLSGCSQPLSGFPSQSPQPGLQP